MWQSYALLLNLLSPVPQKTKSFRDIVDILRQNFEPKPLVIAERFRFHHRGQGPGESVANFVAELRLIAMNCEFGTHLDEAL